MKYLLLAYLVCLTNASFAHEAEGGGAKIGPNMAVLEMNDEKGFRLSDASIKRMGIKSIEVSQLKSREIPKASMIQYRAQKAFYRVDNSWFKRVDLKHSFAELGLKSTDKIAIEGVPLLRVIEMEVFGAEADEPTGHHAHDEAHEENENEEHEHAH